MEAIFLFCFTFGAIFTLFTVLLGALGAGLHGIGSHLHLPGLGHGHGIGDVHGVGAAHGHAGAHLPSDHGFHGLGPGMLLNPSAILVGASIFGAVGYAAMHVYALTAAVALALAAPLGLVGTSAMGAFLVQLRRDAGTMHDEDYGLPGTIAMVTVSIAAGGTGEIVFELGGVRRGEGARAVDGRAIPKGASVVVMAYRRGIAYVDSCEHVTHALSPGEGEPPAPAREPPLLPDH